MPINDAYDAELQWFIDEFKWAENDPRRIAMQTVLEEERHIDQLLQDIEKIRWKIQQRKAGIAGIDPKIPLRKSGEAKGPK